MAMPPSPRTVDIYLDQLPEWQRDIATTLRQWIHQAAPEVTEGIKWGAPYFSVNNQHLVWMFAAKGWIHLGFIQGALLSQSTLFVPTTNKAARSIHFCQGQDIHSASVTSLLDEAVVVARAGLRVDLRSPKPGSQTFNLPTYYRDLLRQHNLLDAYKQRPYYQQKGWVQWIDQAKQQSTKERRRLAMLNQLQNGTYMPAKRQPSIS